MAFLFFLLFVIGVVMVIVGIGFFGGDTVDGIAFAIIPFVLIAGGLALISISLKACG